MARVALAIGAEIDLLTPHELSKELDERGNLWFGNPKREPHRLRIPGSTQGNGTGLDTIDLQGPNAGSIWSIQGITLSTENDFEGMLALSEAFGAAAAGSVTLPAGASITGYNVSFETGAAPVSGTASVSGTSNGPIVFKVTSAVLNGSVYRTNFPRPVPPDSPTTAIAVNVPALVGGSAYTIDVYGNKTAGLFIGDPTIQGVGGLLYPGLIIPGWTNTSKENFWVQAGDHAFLAIHGLPLGASACATLYVNEYRTKDASGMSL